jgi:glycerol 3-phosphatase-2
VAGATVEVDGDGLRVVRAGDDPMDLVRAGCAAAWDHADDQKHGSVDPAALLGALYRLEEAGPWER